MMDRITVRYNNCDIGCNVRGNNVFDPNYFQWLVSEDNDSFNIMAAYDRGYMKRYRFDKTQHNYELVS